MLGTSVLKLQLRNQPDRYVMLTSGLVTLGKDETNDFVIVARGVSDFHAEVTMENDQIFIVDLLSSSGTFVNDKRITGRHALRPWQVIRLGSAELELNDPSTARTNIWAVEVTHPSGSVERYDLEPVTSIGRDSDCDISLDSGLLSRRHAEVRIAKGHVDVFDLGSVNGTFLNGRQIDKAFAYPNDEIFIEPYTFLLIGPPIDPVMQESRSSERTQIRNAGTNESAGTNKSAGKQRTEREEDESSIDHQHTRLLDHNRPIACLIEQTSFLNDKTVRLSQRSYEIGRHRSNDIVLRDLSISKFHARIELLHGEWVIEDCDSSNGLMVNGKIVHRAVINDGDTIELGHAAFTFELRPIQARTLG
jgi:pSer/pThr/pTyr-binding forkhead associated (FHA) protein